MKKKIISISMIFLLLLLSGCSKDKQENDDNNNAVTPTVQPTITLSPEDTDQQDTDTDEDNVDEDTWGLEDYYPLLADTEYVYEGTGMEYAAYTRVTDFLDEENSRIQTRTNNGGTETVRVIEIKDGKLSIVNMINETYYRDSLMETETEEVEEILLMEPLVEGTEWSLKDGNTRYISSVDVSVQTPSGDYKALEVTTKGDNYTTKDYYAPQVGLVKSIYQAEDMEVISSLSEINTDKPYTQIIEVFYPDVDEKIYVVPTTLSFRTNAETKQVLQEAISKEVTKETYLPLASINTQINKIALTQDIVQIDFSAEFVSDMNAGAGYESLILQSITNTLGNYYGVQEVLITIDGKPYESGHILMKEGETFPVDMEKVVR